MIPSDKARNICEETIKNTIEENSDLKRQIVLLQHQLDEKERRIKMLKILLLGKSITVPNLTQVKQYGRVNSATQVGKRSTEPYYYII